jgi:hypothetical protein
MKTPLVPIDIISIYKNSQGYPVPLPTRMAKCTPDTFNAIMSISKDLTAAGGKLILSDLFRSYDMQAQAHQDYVSGKKPANSPAPGGSFHEAGRAFDLDLDAMKIKLSDFWKIAEKYGMLPIIDQPNTSKNEAWHFDCRGSHQIVYKYYADGKGKNFTPYKAAAASAILSIGVHVDDFGDNQIQATIQSCIIRLGKNIGNIDGLIGRNTQKALSELAITYDTSKLPDILNQLENLVQKKFPIEFSIT